MLNAGTWAFDPVVMGFEDEGASVLETRLVGNSNADQAGANHGNEAFSQDPDKMNALLE